MSNDSAVRRALQALQGDEPEHPGIEVLEAYVDGRLAEDDRRRVDELAPLLPVVAEDLADLRHIHDQLARPAGRRAVRWGRVAAGVAVAASVLLGVWVATRSPRSSDPAPAIAVLSAADQDVVREALASQRVNIPAGVRALRRPAGTLLGSGAAAPRFSPLTPVATAVRGQRPRFTWTAAGAEAYTVAVFDEQFVEVMRSPRLSITSWTPGADLSRGTSYVWQVTAHRDGGDVRTPQPPDPEARFTVLDAAGAARIAAIEQQVGANPLEFGILLADAGLIGEARAQFARAARAPATEAAATRLLASIEDQGTPSTTKPAQ